MKVIVSTNLAMSHDSWVPSKVRQSVTLAL